jgi:hypothetical protein
MSFAPAHTARPCPTGAFLLLALPLVACGARSELASDLPPPADGGCSSGSSQPTVVATFGTDDLGPTPFALAITPQGAFVELTAGGRPQAIDRVPLQGGTPEGVIAGMNACPSTSPFGAETPIVTDGATLYMIDTTLSATCQGASPSVSTYDLATRTLGTVPSPAGTGSLNVDALRATTQPGVYYLTGSEFDPSTSVLVHWDGTTSTVIANLPEWCWDLQIVGERIIVMGAHALYELPIDGGAATALLPVTFAHGAALLAANSTSVFYTLDGTTILRRNVATDATTTVATPAEPSLTSVRTWADDEYFYFGAGSPVPSGLLRVPVDGGPIETFWSAVRQINAVTTVGCSVYWLGGTDFPNGRPPELLVAPK